MSPEKVLLGRKLAEFPPDFLYLRLQAVEKPAAIISLAFSILFTLLENRQEYCHPVSAAAAVPAKIEHQKICLSFPENVRDKI